jgi:hypothetical protein
MPVHPQPQLFFAQRREPDASQTPTAVRLRRTMKDANLHSCPRIPFGSLQIDGQQSSGIETPMKNETDAAKGKVSRLSHHPGGILGRGLELAHRFPLIQIAQKCTTFRNREVPRASLGGDCHHGSKGDEQDVVVRFLTKHREVKVNRQTGQSFIGNHHLIDSNSRIGLYLSTPIRPLSPWASCHSDPKLLVPDGLGDPSGRIFSFSYKGSRD